MKRLFAFAMFCVVVAPVMAVMNMKASHHGWFLYLLLTLNSITFVLGMLALWFWNKTRRYQRMVNQ